MFFKNKNEENRQKWLSQVLSHLPNGIRMLDAGAGELKNYKHCKHLNYISQDFSQYKGSNGSSSEGIHPEVWDTSKIDIVCDIASIPEPDASFDAILCSEVFEHIPHPNEALDEFSRLLRPGGILILTAPFSSNVHFAPYHYSTGFSKYWYQYHLIKRGFEIIELKPNGDWFSLLRQEISRLGGLERQKGNLTWPLAYVYSIIGLLYFSLRSDKKADDLACFGWHCLAKKK